jgi:Rieske Fe-S protein
MATVERRTVLKGATVIGAGVAAAPLLAACGGGSSAGAGASTGAPPESSAPAGSSPAPAGSRSAPAGSSSAPAPAGGVTVAKSKVAVGGGEIGSGVVVTQPTAGAYKAFSSTCTHMQCTVSSIDGGFIICPCHGSHYAIATGVPTPSSPAKKPLPPKTVTESGDNLIIS